MRNVFYFLMLSFGIVSCTTMQTFYGKTHQHKPKNKALKIYRLDKSNSTSDIDLSKFYHLKSLNLSRISSAKNLDKIFRTIPYPDRLEVLLLENNQLKKLPISVTRFKSLKQLSLSGNSNLNFRDAFKTLSKNSLEFLNLQHNKLQVLPVEITKLKTLKELNLSYNKLDTQTVFNTVAKLPRLKSLWLRNNQVSVLSDDINKLGQLQRLYLENNKLTTLPDDLSGLKKMMILNLSFNSFQTFPMELLSIPRLVLLHIDNCSINKIPLSFEHKNHSIKGLVIANNNLSKLDKEYWDAKLTNFFLLLF